MTNSLVTPLTKRYGQSIQTYFSGSPLNRVSFLRDNYAFLSDALTNPTTRFLPMQSLDPSIWPDTGLLNSLVYDDVKDAIGNPFERPETEAIAAWDSSKEEPLLIFLGIDESKADGVTYDKYSGQAYFAVDVTAPADPTTPYATKLAGIQKTVQASKALFTSIRMNFVLNFSEAAIYAQARSYMDWNRRNPFCAGCGARTMSVNGGAKRVCPPTDRGVAKGPCPSRGVVTNISFPRSDPTIIVAVVNAAGDRLLLGRNKRFPVGFYSCLAGFCEPAESIEEAVRREVWEESGVKLGKVAIYASQPWPYPASLMIGAIAEALPDGEEIHLEHDPELGDAQWFPFSTVRDALTVAERKSNGLDLEPTETSIKVPPSKAIAHNLMRAVVFENAHLPKI
ncbi:NUDIX hydrolase domain-like protein [Lipomyces kononenkoae]|uniref:NUDIX hydrolase domain-like protein n=1 Tax=Lipomyces kononenkoae TaxID=34357 RepID=A0ACC3SVX0_LIPKO